MDHGWLGTAVKFAQTFADPRIRLGDPLVMADIIEPCWRMVTLDPEFRIGEVAQKSPMSRPVATPDPASLRHHGEELHDILLSDPIFDRHHDGSAAHAHVDGHLGLGPTLE